MSRAACHCGAIIIEVSNTPSEVFECNCSICRKLGVLWAYYHCNDVAFDKGGGTTNVYVWNKGLLGFHSCPTCGCTTHWAAVDPGFREKMGVNARLMEGVSPANTTLQHVDHGELGWFWTRAPGRTG